MYGRRERVKGKRVKEGSEGKENEGKRKRVDGWMDG